MRTGRSVSMVPTAPAYEPHLLEQEAQAVWKARGIPAAGGILGPADGPVVHQFEGTFTPQEAAGLVAHRAVAADVDARYLALAGRRAVGTLRSVAALPGGTESTVGSVLQRLGVWTGGSGAVPWDVDDRPRNVETMVGRLAHRGILVSRDLPLRVCPSCGVPASPERIIYQEEEGDTYLIRFDLPWNDQVVHALVWVDAPWRLLGASAVLLNPELPYVVARYRRKEVEELVLTSAASLDRFRAWIPGASFEVVEEHPGRFFEGRPYNYPLRHEFPTGGALAPPAGTVIAVTDVTDTGTGLVLLVPGHGSTDAAIAETKGVEGWPLVTPKGQLDLTLMHKYAGLDLPTGNDFIVRDLTENGAVFARLRVRRGVPHCADCGTALVWMPGRAWCLEPGRLPPERLELYRRLLPDAPVPSRVEVAPWPVSETARSTDIEAVAVLECSRCERLDALEGPVACPCGGKRYPVRRRLVPSVGGTLAAWARHDPFPVTDSVRLYVGERRRVPAVVHHLMAMSGLGGAVGDVGLTILPTVSRTDLADLVEVHGADAVRVAFVRSPAGVSAAGTFAERCAEARERLARLWSSTLDVLAMCEPAMIAAFAQPVGNSLGELEAEDRALLARWERTRVHALADYDHWAPASVYRRVVRFLETDFSEYRELVRRRLALKGTPTSKRSALRTLAHVLRSASVLLGPIVPHLSEAVHRRLTSERTSIFEGNVSGADRALLNDDLHAAWERWRSVLEAVRRFRHSNGLTPEVALPSAVVLLAADDLADQFRADRPALERLAGIGRLEIGSPREPWLGRHRQIRPVESEIQRFYPAQATQIVHLLQRMPVRKVPEEGATAELSVIVQGLQFRIFPSMVEYSDSLPPRMVPWPWPRGEMYLELPEGVKPPDRVPPPLSSDAFWLVRRLERQLRGAAPEPFASTRVAVVSASDPLASELRSAADGLGRYLGLREFRVLSNVAEAPPPGRWTGRTRTGARWWVHVPGLSAPAPRSKQRRSRPRSPRIPVHPPDLKAVATDYLAEALLAREQAVRALGLELDELLGTPLLGPTKIARAWDRGLTSVEAYRRASFDTLADLPGFGRSIAGTLVMKLGGAAPPPVHRAPRSSAHGAAPPNGHPALPAAPWTHRPPQPARSKTIPPEPVPRRVGVERAASSPTATLVDAVSPLPTPLFAVEPVVRPVSEAGPALPAGRPTVPATSPPTVAERPAVSSPVVDATSPLERSSEERVGGPSGSEPAPPPGLALPEKGSLPLPVVEPAIELPTVSPTAPEEPLQEGILPELVSEPSPQSPVALGEFSSVQVSETVDVEDEPAEEPPRGGVPDDLTEGPPRAEPLTEVPAERLAEAVEILPSQPPTEERTTAPTEALVARSDVVSPVPEPSTPETEAATSLAPPSSLPGQTTGESTPEVRPDTTEGMGTPPTPPAEPPSERIPRAAPSPRETSAPGPPASVQGAEAEAVATTLPELELSGEEATPEAIPEGMPEPTVELLDTAAEVPMAPTLLAEEAAAEPVPPPPEPTPSGVELEVGPSVLTSIRPFLDATAAGHRGVCVVRESPERIAAQIGSRPVDVYWLTNLGRGKTLKPSDLPGLLTFLARALEDDHVMAFFLEGIEYLVRIHGAQPLVDRLKEFDRRAGEHDARVWVHVNPELLAASDLERILTTFGKRTDSP